MIFEFLKYLRPTWYFNLRSARDYAYFPTASQLEKAGFQNTADANYKSNEAAKRDLAWRAFQQGFIANEEEAGLDVWQAEKLPVVDEYRFLRKNFHSAWVLYVYLFRIFSLKNPFKETAAFLKTRKVKRTSHVDNHFNYPEYERFDSPLVKKNPLISVIIPTLNRYDYLKDVFKDLENQTYKNFEVIVVDQTDDFKEEFYKDWNLDLRYWYQEEKALWKARNEAIKSSRGEFILMSEDDIRFPTDFIENHLKALDFFQADASCGVFFPEGSSIPKERSYFKYAEQFATGNALLKKDVFRKIGLYDRQFEKQRMGDGEFGLRMYLNGFKSISNPLAYCIDVKAPEGGLRIGGGSWDAWRPKKWTDPRPVPSVLYLSRKYYGDQASKYWIYHSVLPSVVPYQFKRSRGLKILAVMAVPFLLPFLILQVRKSWKLSGEKLKQGDLIEYIG